MKTFQVVALGHGDRFVVRDRDGKRRRGPCTYAAAQRWIDKQLRKARRG